MVSEISLTKGMVALVDDADYGRISSFNWHVKQSKYLCYAARNAPSPNRGTIRMHHEVLGIVLESGFQVDHADGDGLNNQRGNLRVATYGQNQMNRAVHSGDSLYKGVSWKLERNKWQVNIRLNNSQKFLGYFISEEEAARAYDAAAREHFGEFARLNFPEVTP